ncbi:MAG TPA: helix-turn-helix domain-containing protein [Rugosimonospora sp.]|nr:helix-turn-helix domain-containing protein [Rugosimonospora sp.]
MSQEDGRVQSMIRLGLTMYEARAYLALIKRDEYAAAQLASAAGIPRQRIYDVLDGLVRRQLATTRPGRVTSYRAVAPTQAVGLLLDEQRETLSQQEQLAHHLAESLTPTWSQGRDHTDPIDYIEVLRDPRTITSRFTTIQRNARYEVLCFAKPPFISLPSASAETLRMIRRLTRSGGCVRSVYTCDALDDPTTLDSLLNFANAGEGIRVTDELPLKLVIADQARVLFGMTDPVADADSTTALVIEHPALAITLREAFTTIWDKAEPLDKAVAAR